MKMTMKDYVFPINTIKIDEWWDLIEFEGTEDSN